MAPDHTTSPHPSELAVLKWLLLLLLLMLLLLLLLLPVVHYLWAIIQLIFNFSAINFCIYARSVDIRVERVTVNGVESGGGWQRLLIVTTTYSINRHSSLLQVQDLCT